MKQKFITETTTSAARREPLVYRALLTQSSTDAPVAVEIENTIGKAAYAYVDAGKYTVTFDGSPLVANKTSLRITIPQDLDALTPDVNVAGALRISTSVVRITNTTSDAVGGASAPANGILADAFFEVMVY